MWYEAVVAYLSTTPVFFPEGQRKTTKTLSQDTLSRGRDLNAGPPEYDAGVLDTRPRRSVISVCAVCLLSEHSRVQNELTRRVCIAQSRVRLLIGLLEFDPRQEQDCFLTTRSFASGVHHVSSCY
jgi:hypothetical protein